MTEAGWTREIGESGWYWWRLDDGQLQIVYVSMGGTVSIFGVGKRSLKRLDGEFKGPITPDSYQQGRVAVNVDALVDRFLAWPLPASVCSDLCATKQGSPHRSGTNLLSAVEAKAMIEHVLGIAQQAQEGGEHEE